MFRIIIITVMSLSLIACSGRPELENQAAAEPQLVLEEYFDGTLTAWGQFQDLFGEVRRRFTVDIEGNWDGETLTLVEDFTYADGGTEQRIWTLRPTDNGAWEGSADGVIGTASGQISGNAFNWTYTIDLPLADGTTMRVSFDDWMWLLDEDVVLNRAYLMRYGVEIGQVIIFFQRTANEI